MDILHAEFRHIKLAEASLLSHKGFAMRFTALLVLFVSPLASAEEVKIVLWNAEKLFDVGTVNNRSDDLEDFGQHFQDADIVILDEVTSLSVVNAARNKMGFTDFHTACSDFHQNDSLTFSSLEVGIISKFPLTNVVEFDTSPDNTGDPGEPDEEHLERVNVPGIANVNPSRGFLTAHVPSLGVTLVCTHLKSSGGPVAQEQDNAKKREFVAAAMVKLVVDTLESSPTVTVLVAGDMNVGETDGTKNGFRLAQDHFDPAVGDLYDDTHAIFSAGLIDGLHMASLTKGIGSETYDDPQFAGSGPIDCMYVAGKQTADFTLAKKSPVTFGSDHFAVSTRFLFAGSVPIPGTSSVHIAALMPNPDGADVGNEWVKLKNGTSVAVNLNAWKLRDEANHTVTLSGTIAPGDELKIELSAGQMPLNNSGDEVELLDASGTSVHVVSYSSDQVSSGVEIAFSP